MQPSVAGGTKRPLSANDAGGRKVARTDEWYAILSPKMDDEKKFATNKRVKTDHPDAALLVYISDPSALLPEKSHDVACYDLVVLFLHVKISILLIFLFFFFYLAANRTAH